MEHAQLGCLTGVGSLQTALDFELDAALAEYGAVLGVECIAAAELVELAALAVVEHVELVQMVETLAPHHP